jgi:hypothetical protein
MYEYVHMYRQSAQTQLMTNKFQTLFGTLHLHKWHTYVYVNGIHTCL